MITHAQILERLGGLEVVAAALDRDASTISRWNTKGIPPYAFGAVLALAKRKRLKLAFADLAKATNPRHQFTNQPSQKRLRSRGSAA